jgi:hypothetical protein
MATDVHPRLTRDTRVQPLGERTDSPNLSHPGNLHRCSPACWRSVWLAGLLVVGARNHDAVGAMFRGYGLTRAGRS